MQNDNEKSDSLRIQVSHVCQVAADHVDLFFQVKGSSLITGSSALTQAREVNRLVIDLTQAGIAEAEIHLLNVSAEVTTGIFSKSSSATYTLRARCCQLESLAAVLMAATDGKNTTLESLRWGYPDSTESELVILEECYRKAGVKGSRLAAALGMKLDGVHSALDQRIDPEDERPRGEPSLEYGGGSIRRRASSDLNGVPMNHSKQITFLVTVVYRLTKA